MRIAYFTSHVYGPDFGSVLPNAPKPNPAGQNFHELLIRALAQFASVDVYSYVPWMLDLEEKDFTAEPSITYHYVKTSTNKIARALFGSMKLKGRASKNPCDIVFFDSLNRSAAKAAINSVVMALRNELKGTGIRVAAVLPGDVKTDFTAQREKNTVNEKLYPNEVKSVAKMEHDEQHGMSPDRIAKRFYRLSLQKNPKPFCSVGVAYSAVLILVKLLPARLANFILGKMYA